MQWNVEFWNGYIGRVSRWKEGAILFRGGLLRHELLEKLRGSGKFWILQRRKACPKTPKIWWLSQHLPDQVQR